MLTEHTAFPLFPFPRILFRFRTFRQYSGKNRLGTRRQELLGRFQRLQPCVITQPFLSQYKVVRHLGCSFVDTQPERQLRVRQTIFMSLVQKRQLVALLFCDVVGYGSITTADEQLGLELLEEYRTIVRRFLHLHGGRENKTIGDAFFMEFSSAIDAVFFSIELQTCFYERNLGEPTNKRILTRIGIHLGDVVLAEGDSLGEGVNIAARIEGFAEPGGICVSRTVADQVFPYQQIKLKRMGKKKLKHISHRTVLYKIKLPWEKTRGPTWWPFHKNGELKTRFSASRPEEQLRQAALAGLALSVMALFAYLSFYSFSDYRAYRLGRQNRQIASSVTQRFSLADGWEFAHRNYEEPIEIIASPNSAMEWNPLTRPYGRYADQLSTPYWMKRVFVSKTLWEQPAIVLGPICGAHRAYLNGHFIGGSDYTFTLVYYPFDRSLLKKNANNVLIIKVDPKPSITPGIVSLPQVPSFLGEFHDVYSVVAKNEFYFHIAQNMYLALTLIGFVACLSFYFFNPTNRKYLYFSLYMLLGAMTLLHSNGFIFGFADFRLQRAFRLFGLSLSSLTLLSTYFYLIRRRREELINNGLAIAWIFSMAPFLLSRTLSGKIYLDLWDLVLLVTSAYTATWVVGIALIRSYQVFKEPNRWKEQLNSFRYEFTVLVFGAFTAMLSISSVKGPFSGLLPSQVRASLFALGTTYPFWFALCILGLGLFDYISKNHLLRYRRKMDDMFLGISRITRQSLHGESVLSDILEQVTTFIQAERSTIYLLEEHQGEWILRADSIVSSHDAKPLVLKVTEVKHGILGYVCENRAPLFIRDVASDIRFQKHILTRKREGFHSYKTNSCMLFPLVVGEQLVGILTIADKSGDLEFSERDFSLLNVVATNLAVVIHAQRATGKTPAEPFDVRPKALIKAS